MTRTSFLFALLFAAICTAQSRREMDHPVRQAVRGTHGAVAAGSEYATEAGMRTFYKGGNAVDAGVAAMFAAAVTELSHFGMGGEAPILIRNKAGKVFAIAGVGTMPKLATSELFRTRRILPFEIIQMDPGGLKGVIPVAGIMPALVPGMVDAGLLALREFGTKSFAEIMAPAIELADGYAIDEMRAGSIARNRPFFNSWPTSKGHFMPTAWRPALGRFSANRIWRALCAQWSKPRRRHLPRALLAPPRSTRFRDYFYRGEIAKKDRRVQQSQQRAAALRGHGRVQVGSGRRGFDNLQGIQSLQARLLDPGTFDAPSPEHPGGVRFEAGATEFG
jgi:gamma-glutamyltranspeptidase/glutathione hydrolase